MAQRRRLSLDFETFSEVDLTVVGTSRYARHPSTEVLMLAYAFDAGPVRQWVPAEGEPFPDPMVDELQDALLDPDVVKYAWNKQFEWEILLRVLGIEIPHEQWRDTMVRSYALSLPGSLEKAGEVVDLPYDVRKLSRGKALIRKFCQPREPTKLKPWTRSTHLTDPEDWEEFKLYNRQDVDAERAIERRTRKWDLSEEEWALWHLDQRINAAGIPIRMPVVRNAIKVAREVTSTRLAEMRELTELDNPNSGQQLLPWLQDRGYPFDDLKKGHVKRALQKLEEQCIFPETEIETRTLRRVLELRLEVSKSSVKKYNALAASTDDDGHLRYTLQFAGAGRTNRWSGRKFQPQNLARPVDYLEKRQAEAVRDLEFLDTEMIEWLYPKPMDLLSTCVRPVVQAPEGFVFVDADLNAIENRVLGWLADDQKILDVFRKKRDPYVDFATYMYGGSYDALWLEYKAGRKEKRTISKPAVLGCGYMLGPGEEVENEQTGEIEATGLLGYALNMNVKMTAEQAEIAVRVWRETFKDVVEYWWELDRAARRCVRTGEPQKAGRISFDRSGPFMRMILPSGRPLYYCRPRLENRRTPWGETKLQITYENLNDKNQWVRVSTHPGKIMENADQAVSRDLLAHGMRLAARRGIDIRLHVHDQIVGMVPEDQGEKWLRVLLDCMQEPPPWAGNSLPLGAEGTISRIFIKD